MLKEIEIDLRITPLHVNLCLSSKGCMKKCSYNNTLLLQPPTCIVVEVELIVEVGTQFSQFILKQSSSELFSFFSLSNIYLFTSFCRGFFLFPILILYGYNKIKGAISQLPESVTEPNDLENILLTRKIMQIRLLSYIDN